MPAWLKIADRFSVAHLCGLQGWRRAGFWQAVLATCSLLFLIGCLAKPASREDETTTDFRQISKVFDAMQSFHNRPPRDLDEIKQWLSDFHKDGLNEEPEKVLTSSRDNQPYVIVLGARLGSEPGDALVIFEKTGAEGTRYVMNATRQVQQLTEEQFRQARIAQGTRSDAN
jgi:hypothetical protein